LIARESFPVQTEGEIRKAIMEGCDLPEVLSAGDITVVFRVEDRILMDRADDSRLP
jgi:hypothetical protein